VKLTRISLACLLFCLAAQVVAPAQDTTARVTASLNAIVAGDNNTARREAIVAQLRALGVDPVVELFGEGRAAGANVVVTVPGSRTRRIVIGAHLDRVNAGRGAVDNGAACAALIELAAVFKASPLTQATLQIVFFDREENGLVGSRMYFSTPGHRADYAINLDIFAYGDTIFATGSRPNGLLLRSLHATAETAGLPVREVPPDRYPNSDHKTMMNAQIETLGVALIDKADVDGVLAGDVERLQLGTGPRILRIIHSRNDTMEAVRIDQMARGITFLEQLIRRVDAND
jgi:acetylornithine deacetylase/succinyl-diaminopimelate desuccinylase-like protein